MSFFRRFETAEIPADDEGMSEWLINLYQEKVMLSSQPWPSLPSLSPSLPPLHLFELPVTPLIPSPHTQRDYRMS